MYKEAFKVACQLLNGDCIYGIDSDTIFTEIMKQKGFVSSHDYEAYIIKHLDEFSDNDEIRLKAKKARKAK